MGVQLTRYLNDARARTLEPGGTFTLGAVNTTLFEGEIDYQAIPDGQVGFWLLEMTRACFCFFFSLCGLDWMLIWGRGGVELTAQGSSVSLSSGAASYAAIDTGTTLVGGPQSVIAELYAAIPGSSPATGEWEGYYQYRKSPSHTLPFPSSFIYGVVAVGGGGGV